MIEKDTFERVLLSVLHYYPTWGDSFWESLNSQDGCKLIDLRKKAKAKTFKIVNALMAEAIICKGYVPQKKSGRPSITLYDFYNCPPHFKIVTPRLWGEITIVIDGEAQTIYSKDGKNAKKEIKKMLKGII